VHLLHLAQVPCVVCDTAVAGMLTLLLLVLVLRQVWCA
jgi:hypothetical protein